MSDFIWKKLFFVIYYVRMKKKSPLFVIGVIIIALCICAGIFALVYINIKAKTPKEVSIKEDAGKIVMTASSKNNGYGYTFKFKGEDTIYITSDFNFLEVNDEVINKGIELGKEYEVSYCVNGELEGANSDYSKAVKWTAKQYLQAPTISVEDDKLVWNKVKNAEYYVISYYILDELNTYRVNTNECELSLLKGGDYNIYVTSNSSKSYFLGSEKSNVIENKKVTHEIPAFSTLEFNLTTKTLLIYSAESISKINIYLGNSKDAVIEYVFTTTKILAVDDMYKIECDLDLIYSNETYIGASPFAEGVNSFNGEICWYSVA